jgi:DNA-binding NarL/FixJ family response regulator
VVEPVDIDDAEVAVVVADRVDDEILRVLRALQRNGCPRVLLLVNHIDQAGMLAAVEAGTGGLLRRAEATPERLGAAVCSVRAGEGTLPPDVLNNLIQGMEAGHSRGFGFSALPVKRFSEREVAVLRLLADGHGTAAVARRLNYSERTVKNVIHELNTRHRLRNRSHAVAYAMRSGVI